jgi:hypothetical protein
MDSGSSRKEGGGKGKGMVERHWATVHINDAHDLLDIACILFQRSCTMSRRPGTNRLPTHQLTGTKQAMIDFLFGTVAAPRNMTVSNCRVFFFD